MIAIDVGNSRVKWAHFRHGERQSGGVSVYTADTFEQCLDGLQMPLQYGRVFISLVSTDEIKDRLGRWLESKYCADYEFAVTEPEMLGVKCAYRQPETLGVDRWLAIIAGYHHEARPEGHALCVLDCGTAVTLDVVDAKGRHLGGWIMPGYRTMLHSLAINAANLDIPQVKMLLENPGLADNTSDAINDGVAMLMMRGLSAIIEEQSGRLGIQVYCLVTGGDAEWLSGTPGWHCVHEPYLVLQGLERISRVSERIKHKLK